jgi:antitoxin component YwqK of YwqJK toxin-antitoxin module
MNISIKRLLLSLVIFLGGTSAFAQLENTTRDVARKHPNGKPYVVVYMKNTTGEIVKEEVYYSNGNLEWEGFYKRSIEEGSWKYYYPNGILKSNQYYIKGKENGVFLDYNESGKLVKQSLFKDGKLISEQSF